MHLSLFIHLVIFLIHPLLVHSPSPTFSSLVHFCVFSHLFLVIRISSPSFFFFLNLCLRLLSVLILFPYIVSLSCILVLCHAVLPFCLGSSLLSHPNSFHPFPNLLLKSFFFSSFPSILHHHCEIFCLLTNTQNKQL